METKAVIDRIEEGARAVLLVGEEEREFVLPAGQLPQGAAAGTWLRVQRTESELTVLGLDPREDEAVRQRIDAKLARLRNRASRLRPAGE